ncbi:MAG: hypothetical protein H7330_17325 [Hymenobacteraceae bacterium]|nr:hypothetical protein [Hymenobacteraceae bacterium]
MPVEHSAYTTLVRGGVVELMIGEIRPLTDGALTVQPTLSAAAALPAALAFVGARQYMWEQAGEGALTRLTEGKTSFRSTGKLVIVDDALAPEQTTARPVLAWKFDIYAARPLSRAWIYVDARTGRVVNQDAVIKHADAPGTFETRYSGTRSIVTDKFQLSPLSYRLRETGRGQGIETYSWHHATKTATAADLTDANNT